MTSNHGRNPFGIFKSKRAKCLATKYSLELYNKSAYIHNKDLILYTDVKFIIDNLWLDHFMYNSPKPIYLTQYDYYTMYNYLIYTYPNLNNMLAPNYQN